MSKISEKNLTGMCKGYLTRMSDAPVKYPKVFVDDYEVNGVEQVVENGRIVKKSCVTKVHPQDRMRGLKASDFALENVISIGALDSLKEGHLTIGSTSELSDSMEGTIDNLISAVDAAESNVEPQYNV